VAITRAKKKLYLSHASERMLFGRTDRNRVSRFIKELPSENIEKQEEQGISFGDQSNKGTINAFHSISLQEQLAHKRNENKTVSTERFSAGDKVKHNIFGEGMVLKATPMAGDTLLEIAFETKGTKKIMANFAKIKKL